MSKHQIERARAHELIVPSLVANAKMIEALNPHFIYRFECLDPSGRLKWVDEFINVVTTVGKNYLLDAGFRGGTPVTTWYLALIDNAGFSAVAAADTAASHAGWAESTAYSNGTRPAATWSAAASGQIAPSAASAFNINAAATIKGAGVISNSTKGGTTGTLYSAGAFAANRGVDTGDTLNVSLTLAL